MTSLPPPPVDLDDGGQVDYLVVGAGSAGCVLAEGLGAADDRSVVILEAGPADTATKIRIPAAFPDLFGTEVDWNYQTTAQDQLGGRPVPWPRGRTLGGSSSINAQIWTRGHPADYDRWQASGPGWSAADVLPYFERVERELHIEEQRDPHPTTHDFLASCGAAGLPVEGVPAREGAGLFRVTQRAGRRWSSADAYLRPALARGNVRALAGAYVRRILLDGYRARGVEYQIGSGPPRRLYAHREVIVAAGVIGSPILLMRSGIGDPAQLETAGVELVGASPEVGRNLADHLMVPLTFVGPPHAAPPPARVAALRYLSGRRGPLTSNLAEAALFTRSHPSLAAPDLELVWMVRPPPDDADRPPAFTLGVVLLQPTSRGAVRLRGGATEIDPGYLTDPAGADLAVLRAGLRTAQDLLDSDPLRKWLGAPVDARWCARDEQSLTALIRDRAETLYHPVGTCRMGAVVDPCLRVRGINRLRVADASIMPRITRGHTHAPTVMIAKRAVDFIRSDGEG